MFFSFYSKTLDEGRGA